MAYTVSGDATADGGSIVLNNGGAISTTLAAAAGTTSYTLDMPAAAGAATSLFKTNGTTAATFKISKPLMWYVQNIRGSNSSGGTINTGSWTTTYFLSTVRSTPGNNGEVTLNTGNDQITITSGTYYMVACIPISKSAPGTLSTHQVRINNITLGTFVYGMTGLVKAQSCTAIYVADIFTVPSGTSHVFQIQARATNSNTSFGVAVNLGTSSMENIKILKLSP